ncbi:MAG: hypothetical protein M0Q42_04625 [Xanthomonadales bacterium]|nr:hypothetical protein [Xanthomonadales bacterium]
MSRKNTILGLGALAAFGFASMAFAQCPSGPVPPWSGVTQNAGTAAIVEGGYDGTSCRLDAAITGNLGSAGAFVSDDTPTDEPRYRARFLVDVDNLDGLNSSQPVRIFAATTSAPANGVPDLVSLSVYGNAAGTSKILGISTACSSNATGRCSTTRSLGSVTGARSIEIDWQSGSSGGLAVWVDNNVEGTPSATLDADNSAWGGVDNAVLGLAAASSGYRAVHLNKTVGFDEFDSRRSTFIGQ